MKAIIYFKDSSVKSCVTIENLSLIKGRSSDEHKRPKNYDTEEKFLIFTPFADESYSFTGSNGTFSIAGAEILYVEFNAD